MKKVRPSREVRRIFRGSSGGFTLIEVLVALALFGIIAITFLGGLTTASRAVLTGDVRTTAESLARTQMESIKNQEYIPADAYDPEESGSGEVVYGEIDINPDEFPGYTIWSANRDDEIVEDVLGIPWDSEGNQPVDEDNELQRIKLVIKHEDRYIFSLEGYKVDR